MTWLATRPASTGEAQPQTRGADPGLARARRLARGATLMAVRALQKGTLKRLPGPINDMRLVVIEGDPHAIPWTHAGQVNTALLDFIRN